MSNYHDFAFVNTSKDKFIDLLKTDEKIILVDGPNGIRKKVTLVGLIKITAIDTHIVVEDANGLTRDIEVKFWQ